MREQLVLFETTKKCTKCGEVKEFREFPYSSTTKSRIRSRCKECRNAESRKYKNSDRGIETEARWLNGIRELRKPKRNLSYKKSQKRKLLRRRTIRAYNVQPPPNNIICNCCNEIKTFNLFGTQRDGRRKTLKRKSICKKCHAEKLMVQNLQSTESRKRIRIKNKHQSVIYFIECDGWIKIGYTTNLTARIRSLIYGKSEKYGHPIHKHNGLTRLNTLEFVDGGRKKERTIHSLYPMIRHGASEWFKATPKLYNFISKVDIAS